MFRGSNEINMDAKGRMAMPVRYRDDLTGEPDGCLVVTIDVHDKCLLIYPRPEWDGLEEQIRALPTFNPKTRRLQRLLIGHARDLELDGNGRILIPPELRDYAELEKKVILVGQGHRLELWNLESWNDQRGVWLNQAADELDLPVEMQSLSL